MTTITIDESLVLPKTHFADSVEAVFYLVQSHALGLSQTEITKSSKKFIKAMQRYNQGEAIDGSIFLQQLIDQKHHVSL